MLKINIFLDQDLLYSLGAFSTVYQIQRNNAEIRIEKMIFKNKSSSTSDLQTTTYRNMILDLGNGLKTNARPNLPANGDGPILAFFLYGFWAC
jgi:hypothetical protein